MKTLAWTGSKGNKIELRVSYIEKMVERNLTSDGFVYGTETKPTIEANLELWIDGTKVDTCRDVSFWKILDLPSHPGFKSIWGLKVGFSAERAAEVEKFLAEAVRSGKSEEVKQYEAEQAEKRKAAEKTRAQEIVEAAKKTRRNQDGSLMSEAQAAAWRRSYNDMVNEGGEGYVPSIVTQEQLDRALEILAKQ